VAAAAVVAVTAAAGWAISRDEVIRLGVTGAVNANVSLAASGNDVAVVWAARSASSTNVEAALSRDGGRSFGPPVRVNDVDGDARVSGEQAPRVALGDAVDVVWVSRDGGSSSVRTARAPIGSFAFGSTTTIHAPGLAGARGWPSLAGDGPVLHIAWLDGRDGHAEPSRQGGGHHAMRQDIFETTRRPDGTRDEVRVASDVCFCCKTAVATAPGGTVYVAWRNIYPPNLRDMAVARSTDGGRTFGPPVRVSEDHWAIDGCPEDGPSMVADPGGVVHVVWPTMVDGEAKGVFYTSSADGGRTFGPRLRIDDGGAPAAHPQIALARDRVVVVWDQGGSEHRVFLRGIERDTAESRDRPRLLPIVAVSSGPSRAVYPAVASSSSAVLVAWTEETPGGSEIRLRRVEP
jgi:hypothetical protein